MNEPTTPSSLCLVSQEGRMPWCHENDWTQAGYTQCGFRCCRSITEQISTLSKFSKSWEHAKEVYTCFVNLGKVWEVHFWLPREKFCGIRFWLVPLVTQLSSVRVTNHNCSVVLSITTVQRWCCTQAMVCAVTTLLSILGLSTQRLAGQIRPVKPFHPAAIHFANNEKIIYSQKMCWFSRM